MKKTTLNDLNDHLFETIERLLLSNDPDADEKEKIDIETAKAISSVGDIIVKSAKLHVDALKAISFSQNPQMVREFLSKTGPLLLNNDNEIVTEESV